MKRPQQHIIETKSKKKFEALIPDTWVARELSADYGLDYLVEIFKNNYSTGHLFFVQLKGTDSGIVNDTISYQLSLDNIKYWNTITNPVLLVFYSSKSSNFWGVWTNEMKENLILKKEDQKKVTITLTAKNLITPTFFTELETIFDNSIPSKINVAYQGNTSETKLLHQCLEKWLKHFFKDDVLSENHMLPNTYIVDYKNIAPELLKISITTKGKTHYLQPVKLLGNENYLFLPNIEIGKIPKPLSECLLLFSLLNCQKNIKASIKIIQTTITDYTGDYLTIESFLLLTKTAILNDRTSEISELAKTFVLSDKIDEFQFLNSSILLLNKDKSLNKLYQDNLKFAIERIADTHMRGILSYNLANSFRSSSNYYLSSLNYQNARRFEPEYRDRFYWWFEYAGVLFLSGHYKIAEAFYLKSHELDNTQNIPLIFGLIGDCKFFQGKFSDSIVYFERLINQQMKLSSFSDEYIIKSLMTKTLVAEELDNSEIDFRESDKLALEGLEKKDGKFFYEAIRKNPLNGMAWFNYAVSLNLKGDSESALTAFLMTACIQPWDSEAWRNSLGLALTTKRLDIFTIIYGAANKNIGSDFLNYFSQSILDQPNLPIETKQELIKTFTNISKIYSEEQDSV
jgi:tetratricopeptide (TPR) repeat protein